MMRNFATLELSVCENLAFSQPLTHKIIIPEEVTYVYLKVTVRKETYKYSYSFDQKEWKEIDVPLESIRLSDDFIRGGGFFTGAFVGMQCQDTSGERLPADFHYFRYEETDE